MYISDQCKQNNHVNDFTSENMCIDNNCKCKCHLQAAKILTRQEIEDMLISSYYESDE